MPISVMIVEDEPEFMRVMSEAVLSDPGLRLLAAVSSGGAALAVLSASSSGRGQLPDVLLVDLGLPDMHGVEVIRHAAAHCAGCDVLVVTMFANDAHILNSIAAGAVGYLLKDAGSAHIVASIHEVHAGGSPISPSIARRLLSSMRIGPAASEPVPDGGTDLLSAREIQILRLTAKGLSFEAVSEVLGISPHTVVSHVKKIYRKLAVHSRGEAVFEASQLGLL